MERRSRRSRPRNLLPAWRVDFSVIMSEVRIGNAAAGNPADAQVVDGQTKIFGERIHAGVACHKVGAGRHVVDVETGALDSRRLLEGVGRDADGLVSAVAG